MMPKTNPMSENSFPRPNFNEEITFDPQAKIEVSGHELSILFGFFDAFSTPVAVMNKLMQKSLAEGKSKFIYRYADGSIVPDQIVEEHQKKVKAFFEKMRPDQTVPQEELPQEQSLIITGAE